MVKKALEEKAKIRQEMSVFWWDNTLHLLQHSLDCLLKGVEEEKRWGIHGRTPLNVMKSVTKEKDLLILRTLDLEYPYEDAKLLKLNSKKVKSNIISELKDQIRFALRVKKELSSPRHFKKVLSSLIRIDSLLNSK